MRARRGAAAVLALLLSTFVGAHAGTAPSITGQWRQGALLVGTVAPGSTVRFGDRVLQVSGEGRFALGLAYDAPPAAALEVQPPGGAPVRYEYAVAQRTYDSQPISGLPKEMVEPPPQVQARIELDQQRVSEARAFDSALTDFAGGFRWPVSAEITGIYGSARVLNGIPKQPHFGIDLAAPEGTPVRAAAGGIARLARTDLYYTGGTIILDHGHGVTTTYLHLSSVQVKQGQAVHAGDIIGKVGHTGRATGPHLCWRANWFDVRLDASLLLQAEPAKKGEMKR
ncbi:MAG TPA: M23 family metallopeptidase [Nevskiaceae bacterium]|nr:M23 family metallopeptidase [Nevskiaceae bacterium]